MMGLQSFFTHKKIILLKCFEIYEKKNKKNKKNVPTQKKTKKKKYRKLYIFVWYFKKIVTFHQKDHTMDIVYHVNLYTSYYITLIISCTSMTHFLFFDFLYRLMVIPKTQNAVKPFTVGSKL